MTAGESLIIGLLLFPYSLWEVIEALVGMFRIRAIRKDGVRIQGTVTELVYDDEETASPRLRVQYQAENGRTYRITTNAGLISWGGMAGKTTAVIYRRSNPTAAFIEVERGPSRFFFVLHCLLASIGGYYFCNAILLFLE